MKLSSIQKLRRFELQKAAYEVARKQGFHYITVAQIARHAGTSKGVVHHYFKSKKQLIEYAVRYSHRVYRNTIVSRLKEARTPSERLWSIIDGTFDPDQFNAEICRLWLTIFDELKHDRKLARLVAILDKRSVSLTLSAVKELVEEHEVNDKAYTIMGLMDGLWILSASDPEITRETALRDLAAYICRNIPRFDPSAVRLQD
jgi:TetR/AcrR family transcriptional regulator, transcriptional repressor of bet genes